MNGEHKDPAGLAPGGYGSEERRHQKLLRPTVPRGLRRLVIGSVSVHLVALITALVAGRISVQAKPVPPHTFIPTKLVRLGKKRPKNLLPRLNRPPPPAAKPDVSLKPAKPDAPTTTETPQKALSALDRAKELSRTSRALDRLKKTNAVEPDGDPDGVEEGEVSDAQAAIIGNKYATEIYRCMKKNYAIEGVSRSRVANRQASILVRVQSDGKLFGIKLLKKSGLAAFDRAVERAVARCGKVSKPPELLRDQVKSDGIEIHFKP